MTIAADILDLARVTRRFGAVTAVDAISFAAKAGETLALLGPSGCGKTTTLRLIAGFEQPDDGAISIAGEGVAGKRPYEREVGLLFQSYALFPHMTVAGNIAYGLKNRGWPRDQIGKRVAEMLKLVHLEGLDARLPRQLSGGQQQRVALARVLATKPKLILLDEPLSALDAKMREELRVELKQIISTVGSTAIVVTHDQEEAMSLADRIIVMNHGRIEQSGTPTEIYSRPASRFVASFIGRINWIEATLAETRTDGLGVYRTRAGWRLLAPSVTLTEGSVVQIGLRPEHIDLETMAGDDMDALSGRFRARIVDQINLGPTVQYYLETPDGRLSASMAGGGVPLATGDVMVASYRPESAIVFARGAE